MKAETIRMYRNMAKSLGDLSILRFLGPSEDVLRRCGNNKPHNTVQKQQQVLRRLQKGRP